MGGNQRIFTSLNGRTWKPLKGQRRAGNISSGVVKLKATTLVRIQDGAGKGPSRKIWGR